MEKLPLRGGSEGYFVFVAGDYIFYGAGGVCKIDAVLSAPLEHMPKDRMYYVMHSLDDPSGVIYVPVDSEMVFLRPLLTREEAEALLLRVSEILPIEESNAKLLRERYLAAMRTHCPDEWVRVVKTVRRRREAMGNGRPARLSETERSFGESASHHLERELSLVLGLRGEELERYVLERIG